MGVSISESVGQGGVNHHGDVLVVQALLNRATRANLATDGKCGPATVKAIQAFQSGFMKTPDGRIDLGGTSWKKLLDAPAAAGPPAQPIPLVDRNASLVAAVDADSTLNGAGITLIDANGQKTEIRGGPRRKWLYISAVPLTVVPAADKQLSSFWDRWGNSVLNCGSAAATGVVIYLSGGTASPVVGAFAVNSAALCGMSVGKAIEYNAWQEFEREGGGAYKAWLTIETAMSLADLFNGVKGAMGAVKAWKEAGHLTKLEKALRGKKLTRKQLVKAIQQIDPKFQPNLASKGAGYYSKAKLAIAGQEVLAANKFRSLTNQQARVVSDAVGNAFTLAGTPDTWKGSTKTYEAWVVQYDDKPETE